MNKNAVTALELLVVVIIIGILAAIAVPVYTTRVERARGERAIVNIELIVDAYKQYYVRFDDDPDPLPGTLTAINNAFNLDLSDNNFRYQIIDQGTYRQIQVTRMDSTENILYNLNPESGILPGGVSEWEGSWDWLPS